MTKIIQRELQRYREKEWIFGGIWGVLAIFDHIRGTVSCQFLGGCANYDEKSRISEKTFSKPLAKIRKMWYIIMLGYFGCLTNMDYEIKGNKCYVRTQKHFVSRLRNSSVGSLLLRHIFNGPECDRHKILG